MTHPAKMINLKLLVAVSISVSVLLGHGFASAVSTNDLFVLFYQS